MSQLVSYRLDDLRRFAAALGSAVGLSPARAMAFASHLLWFDAAGAPEFGIASLPTWLDRIQRAEIDPKAEGKLGSEHAGTLVVNGQNGLAPLILARASELAVEKARDIGIAAIRVENLGEAGPPAPVAAGVATLGPEVAAVLGPGSQWSLALPRPTGLPLVLDSVLTHPQAPPPTPLAACSLLVPADGWLVVALAVRALESLNTFHGRVLSDLPRASPASGPLAPDTWEARRRGLLERGLAPNPEAFANLSQRASTFAIPQPRPVANH